MSYLNNDTSLYVHRELCRLLWRKCHQHYKPQRNVSSDRVLGVSKCFITAFFPVMSVMFIRLHRRLNGLFVFAKSRWRAYFDDGFHLGAYKILMASQFVL